MDEFKNEKGGVSVDTEHIFPVIKQWLYSEKEIFLREIISNACDAITKHKRLVSLSETEESAEPYKITVTLDAVLKTITVSDNGVGMTREEVKKYLGQIALSGALDFIEKYEGKEDGGNGIIGHFGLGFYSVFMVADTVEVNTRSHSGTEAVKWICADTGSYSFEESDRTSRGTDITLHVNDENGEYLSEFKVRDILNKYCAFIPVEIYFNVVNPEADEKEEKSDENTDTGSDENPNVPINDINPLWQKNPSDCTEEEYKAFYKKVFDDYKDTLFQIHINADYPLNFKGILYFPKLNSEFDNLEGQVKLYYNQVFVADNIKEVVPDYMLMLKGVLDCPEMPLNVSRSYLQSNSYVSKVTNHIVKKVTDKLNSLMNTDREQYEKIWEDLKLFVEYACLRDRKFYEKVKDAVLMKKSSGTYVSFSEYLSEVENQHKDTIYYTNDVVAQAQYLSMFESAAIPVVVFDRAIDTQFVSFIEREQNIKFVRVDADIADALKGDGETVEDSELAELFKKVSGNDALKVKFENLKDESVPAVLNISETSRRFEDMMRMYRVNSGESADFSPPQDATLVLNSNNSLVRKLLDNKNEDVAKQLYTLTLISQRKLTADELKNFFSLSYNILEKSF